MQHQSRKVRLTLVSCLILVSMMSLLGAAPVGAVQPASPASNGQLPQSDSFAVVPYPGDSMEFAELAAVDGKEGGARLDSALQALAGNQLAGATAQALDDAAQIVRDDDGRVQVQLTVSAGQAEAASEAVAAFGGKVTGLSIDKTIIQGFMPVANLEALAAHEAVQFVAAPEQMTSQDEEVQVGLTTTEGVTISNAAAWHAAGFRGNGVRVAVIDGGFEGFTSLLGSDLPSSVITANFADTGTITSGGPHGTACAEIVYDMAPGISLYLIRISTPLDLQEAVTFAISQGVRVISTSVSWYIETPGDGTGFFANEVQRAANAGILWATSAGNNREVHWGGSFSDADNDRVHSFSGYEIDCFGPAPGQCYNINPGFSFIAYLRWNNWTAPVNQDYDLYIMRWNGSSWVSIASGTNLQNGSAAHRPREFAVATTSGAATAYGILVYRYNATGNANLEMFAPRFLPLSSRTIPRTLGNLSDSPAAVTVAALHSVSPYAQEPYSSEGPTNGPGGSAVGGIIKPDLSAFANVNTRSYGTTVGSKFNGTSAATPHVAGALALARGAYPSYAWATVRNLLFGRAIDIGVAGRDNQFGYGRLWLGPPRLMRYEYNGDKRSDILWRHSTTGAMAVWFMNGSLSGSASLPTVSDVNWRTVGGGDFNANGRSDILWRHFASGANAIWFMNGSSVSSSVALPAVTDRSWRMIATGDFNADGRSDILWRNFSSGAVAIWFMNGSTIVGSLPVSTVVLSWGIIGTGDYNGDGYADILWRSSTGGNAIWFMRSATVAGSAGLPAVTDLNWRIVGSGDRNSDGRSDIVWRNIANGANAIWFLNGGSVTGSAALPGVTDTRWQIIHDHDLNGDGRADILWRNAVSGGNAVWLMNGSSIASSFNLPSVTDVRWRMVGNAEANLALSDVDAVADATVDAAVGPPEDMIIGDAMGTPELGAEGDAPAAVASDAIPAIDLKANAVPAEMHTTYLMQLMR